MIFDAVLEFHSIIWVRYLATLIQVEGLLGAFPRYKLGFTKFRTSSIHWLLMFISIA